MEYLRDLVQKRLHLRSTSADTPCAAAVIVDDSLKGMEKRILLDVGGGTGNFTRAVIENATIPVHGIVIDPFLINDDVAQNPDPPGSDQNDPAKLSFVKQSAQIFVDSSNISPEDMWWRKGYHHVLMKEVVHHIPDRVPIFRGIRHGLDDAANMPCSNSNSTSEIIPSLLIITRPQHDIDYPLWDAARAIWAQHEPSLEELVSELQEAGFTNIQHTLEAYPCAIPLHRWLSMVLARFWSTFSYFTDEQLEEGCASITRNYQHPLNPEGNDDGIIHFEDRLIFITACK